MRPCDDLLAPDHGTSTCEEDEDGVKTCTVECDEGFTHSLKFNTSFTCDPRRTGRWPDAKSIPICYGEFARNAIFTLNFWTDNR